METFRDPLNPPNDAELETVKTLCCGYKKEVESRYIDDGDFKPYPASENYIECPDCGEISTLHTLNKAAVKLLNLRQLNQSQSKSSEPHSKDMLEQHR